MHALEVETRCLFRMFRKTGNTLARYLCMHSGFIELYSKHANLLCQVERNRSSLASNNLCDEARADDMQIYAVSNARSMRAR